MMWNVTEHMIFLRSLDVICNFSHFLSGFSLVSMMNSYLQSSQQRVSELLIHCCRQAWCTKWRLPVQWQGVIRGLSSSPSQWQILQTSPDVDTGDMGGNFSEKGEGQSRSLSFSVEQRGARRTLLFSFADVLSQRHRHLPSRQSRSPYSLPARWRTWQCAGERHNSPAHGTCAGCWRSSRARVRTGTGAVAGFGTWPRHLPSLPAAGRACPVCQLPPLRQLSDWQKGMKHKNVWNCQEVCGSRFFFLYDETC